MEDPFGMELLTFGMAVITRADRRLNKAGANGLGCGSTTLVVTGAQVHAAPCVHKASDRLQTNALIGSGDQSDGRIR